MQVPDIEKQTGIDLYVTETEGIGGKLKQTSEDFVVEEITGRDEGNEGKYLILELTKKNWETHHLIRDMSRILGISSKRFGFAGTKDKRALTTQRISIYNLEAEDVERIKLRDVNLKVLGRSNKDVGLGDLVGNKFKIIIRDVDLPQEELDNRLLNITSTINKIDGVPNFFGIQRFGSRRPITHLVGESIVKGDIEKAAIDYIGLSFPDEHEKTRLVRDRFYKERNYIESLKEYPVQLRYERAMMHYLVNNPDDFAAAFGELSSNMRNMFVHAYQSYIYNRIICRRIRENLPLNKAVEGDIVCFKNKQGLPDTSRLETVTSSKIKGINNLIRRGRAFVTAPLVGTSTEFTDSSPGNIEKEILQETGVEQKDFHIPEIPRITSKGRRREILLNVKPAYTIDDDELNAGKKKVTLEFCLPKGSYATTVIREYMKAEPADMS
ncbi:tRNA pseudouridine(13) synthase TruD [Methanohalophilus euhalobius]|uniref:Probable tRNA pseudouridine synthase D n=1 Tax=Methanohalophilus euhalobius TaxID=51203 RepID=A0A314ZT08_9EURY|nr:tRNA pseudouridine(13) synthase TruD [Methanohalophilus euhalobius]PQV42113.1 tRNA pseudouridine13 synthase [Methanohalophilus euhalobius]RNI12307.1 tRNA pseudouridine(13) synthase TruD [Methanohalophilus euhalobius]